VLALETSSVIDHPFLQRRNLRTEFRREYISRLHISVPANHSPGDLLETLPQKYWLLDKSVVESVFLKAPNHDDDCIRRYR
jgi:hypothetical protein